MRGKGTKLGEGIQDFYVRDFYVRDFYHFRDSGFLLLGLFHGAPGLIGERENLKVN